MKKPTKKLSPAARKPEEKLFKDFMKEEIAKGKTEEEREAIREKFCMALLTMNCSGLQGR